MIYMSLHYDIYLVIMIYVLIDLQVVNNDDDFGWGIVVNFQKKADQSKVGFK